MEDPDLEDEEENEGEEGEMEMEDEEENEGGEQELEEEDDESETKEYNVEYIEVRSRNKLCFGGSCVTFVGCLVHIDGANVKRSSVVIMTAM